MPRRFAYVVPLRRRRGPILLALACALFGFVAGLGLSLGVPAAAAPAACLGGITYSLTTRP